MLIIENSLLKEGVWSRYKHSNIFEDAIRLSSVQCRVLCAHLRTNEQIVHLMNGAIRSALMNGAQLLAHYCERRDETNAGEEFSGTRFSCTLLLLE